MKLARRLAADDQAPVVNHLVVSALIRLGCARKSVLELLALTQSRRILDVLRRLGATHGKCFCRCEVSGKTLIHSPSVHGDGGTQKGESESGDAIHGC